MLGPIPLGTFYLDNKIDVENDIDVKISQQFLRIWGLGMQKCSIICQIINDCVSSIYLFIGYRRNPNQCRPAQFTHSLFPRQCLILPGMVLKCLITLFVIPPRWTQHLCLDLGQLNWGLRLQPHCDGTVISAYLCESTKCSKSLF